MVESGGDRWRRDGAPDRGLIGAFYLLDVAFTQLLAALARQRGVSLSEIVALQHLQVDNGLTAGELAARLRMSSGATTALIDRLERAGQAVRGPHPHDRRATVLTLTETGQADVVALLGPYFAAVGALGASLDETEAEVVRRIVARVAAITEEQAEMITRRA